MDEITKINSMTGDIIWRWGGKHNQFKFINDTIGFSHQHYIRRLKNGYYSLYDNGGLHWDLVPARALEYKLDEKNMTAELIWEYRHSPKIYPNGMGNMQRLDNGNTMIGWGSGYPTLTEIDSLKNIIFELTLPDSEWNYRAFRFNLNKSYYNSFVPKLLFPQNKSKLNSDTCLFNWTRNKFAQSFHFQLSLDSTFNNLVYEDSNLVDTLLQYKSLNPKNEYYWRVSSNNNTEDVGGYSGYSDYFKINSLTNEVTIENDNKYYFYENEPNPFSTYTNIKYFIPESVFIQLKLYNEFGVELSTLVNEYQNEGTHVINIIADNLNSGIYFIKLQAGKVLQIKKIVVLK